MHEGWLFDLTTLRGRRDDASEAVSDNDSFSLDGAEKLKAKIEGYWQARGKRVCVRIVQQGFHSAIRAARYDVRSDLVDGLPCEAPAAIEDEAEAA